MPITPSISRVFSMIANASVSLSSSDRLIAIAHPIGVFFNLANPNTYCTALWVAAFSDLALVRHNNKSG